MSDDEIRDNEEGRARARGTGEYGSDLSISGRHDDQGAGCLGCAHWPSPHA
jgi:hypothetical protein